MIELGANLIHTAAGAALFMLTLALLLAVLRLMRGPTLPDRVIALDLIASTAVGIMVTYSVVTHEAAILDAAIVIALIAFLGTVAFASFVERSRTP